MLVPTMRSNNAHVRKEGKAREQVHVASQGRRGGMEESGDGWPTTRSTGALDAHVSGSTDSRGPVWQLAPALPRESI